MNTLAIITGSLLCLSPILFLSLGYWMGYNRIKPRMPWYKDKDEEFYE